MKPGELHRDVLTLLRAGMEDREGLTLMLDVMPESDKRQIMESLVGFGVAMTTTVAMMTGRTPEKMVQELGQIVDFLDSP